MWASGYDNTSYSKTFFKFALFSRCYTAKAQLYIIQRKYQKIQRKIFNAISLGAKAPLGLVGVSESVIAPLTKNIEIAKSPKIAM